MHARLECGDEDASIDGASEDEDEEVLNSIGVVLSQGTKLLRNTFVPAKRNRAHRGSQELGAKSYTAIDWRYACAPVSN